jgi:hypothetical protein
MMCAAVAIAGIPPFSGSSARTRSIGVNMRPGSTAGTITAGMTAFTSRAMFLTFLVNIAA